MAKREVQTHGAKVARDYTVLGLLSTPDLFYTRPPVCKERTEMYLAACSGHQDQLSGDVVKHNPPSITVIVFTQAADYLRDTPKTEPVEG